MAVNIHITIIELNALHTKRQNLFQELDAVIHLLMEAKHWGLRKSRNATSLNSRFKSLDTLKVKIISVTFRRVIRTNHKKASKIWRHENIQLGGCQSRSEERFSRNAETDLVCRLLLEKKKVNAIDFAARRRLDEERVIAAFLHAARLGIFELSWNVLCPGCGGVLDTSTTLKSVKHEDYICALCAAGYEPNLDEMVEVTFTLSRRVRRIAAHEPNDLPFFEYMRQIFWASGMNIPEDLEQIGQEITLDTLELPAGAKAQLSLQLPQEFLIVFEPVTHAAQFIDVKGEPTRERQNLSMVFNDVRAPTGTVVMRPGPLRLTLENRPEKRGLPAAWIAGHPLHQLLARRRPFLNAKRLLTNQTFRDIYRTDTLDLDQRLKITSLTFLFTDLKGSTELYDRVGDLVAFDLVRAHFRVLNEIVAAEAGAVVKTIGDAVMATFPTPDRAMSAALRMREAMRAFNAQHGHEDLLLKDRK